MGRDRRWRRCPCRSSPGGPGAGPAPSGPRGAARVSGPAPAETPPRLSHDVRDAEGVSDLDQLPSGDHPLAAFGERIDAQQDGGSVVVYRKGPLGSREAGEKALYMPLPRASGASGEIEF